MNPIKKTGIFLWLILSLVLTSAASPYSQVGQETEETPNITITQVDVSQFPRVTLYLSATNAAGEPVAVDASKLIIKEDDREITPETVEGEGEVGGLTSMLVMDVSGSMLHDQKLVIAKSVAKEYVNQMRSSDQAGLISFSDQIRVVQDVTGDKELLAEKIDSIYATGDTAMYDALMKAVEVLNPLSGRKAVIALTDGMDNRSVNKPDDVVDAIGDKGLSISTIGFGVPNQGNGNVTALDEKALTYLAENAGGNYGFAKDEASLQKIYQRYDRALKSEYTISYTSPSKLRDGIGRHLTVSLADGAAGVSSSIEAGYNPGGLVPETGGDAPWMLFLALFAGLVVILFIPTLLGLAIKATPARAGKGRAFGAPRKSRIKLK